jgi:uncharacterized protein
MAAGSLLALLDDITTVLDDVAVLSKIAAKKTAGVLGDDLAVNAEQVTGIQAARELPVVWAVFVGSLRNKAMLVPAAMLISVLAPWLITPLLMVGGAYLCFEGAEKLWHLYQPPHDEALHQALADAHTTSPATQARDGDDDTAADTGIDIDVGVDVDVDVDVDMLALEADKIAGAIRTDFVLSGEIIAITLGVVAEQDWLTQATVLSGVALVMTVGVYGLVAAIVKLDDVGLHWQRSASGVLKAMGRGLLWFAPWLMRGLSVVGTAAMFLVGGGIVVHGMDALHHGVEQLASQWGGALGLAWAVSALAHAVLGVALGAVLVAIAAAVHKLRRTPAH